MTMMKRLLAFLLLLPLCAAAKVPDEEDITARTLDPESRFYYPNLMMRYKAGDPTLDNDDYHYLYYGYAYQEGYKPLESGEELDRLMMIAAVIDPENPDRETMERILSAATPVLERDPFNPKVLNLIAFAYGALGDGEKEKTAYEHLKRVLYTIEDSGDGFTQKTPFHILMFDHAFSLLSSYDLDHGKSRIISREVEYIPLQTPRQVMDKKVKGYYFDYSRIYRNKPEGYVFKRERTWQFNNLRPREYK